MKNKQTRRFIEDLVYIDSGWKRRSASRISRALLFSSGVPFLNTFTNFSILSLKEKLHEHEIREFSVDSIQCRSVNSLPLFGHHLHYQTSGPVPAGNNRTSHHVWAYTWIGQVFNQPVPVPHSIEWFPSVHGIAFRSIVNNILRFLKIEIPATQTIGIKIQTENHIDIISKNGGQVSSQRISPAHAVFIEIQSPGY